MEVYLKLFHGTKRNFSDDMSKFDILLQELTSDVSMSEVKKVASDLQYNNIRAQNEKEQGNENVEK